MDTALKQRLKSEMLTASRSHFWTSLVYDTVPTKLFTSLLMAKNVTSPVKRPYTVSDTLVRNFLWAFKSFQQARLLFSANCPGTTSGLVSARPTWQEGMNNHKSHNRLRIYLSVEEKDEDPYLDFFSRTGRGLIDMYATRIGDPRYCPVQFETAMNSTHG